MRIVLAALLVNMIASPVYAQGIPAFTSDLKTLDGQIQVFGETLNKDIDKISPKELSTLKNTKIEDDVTLLEFINTFVGNVELVQDQAKTLAKLLETKLQK